MFYHKPLCHLTLWSADMPKILIKAYDTVIQNEWYEDGASVLIGVADRDNHPEEAFWGWADEKIYFYLD